MTLTIELTPQAERQLVARAASDGVNPAQLAAMLVQHGLSESVVDPGEQGSSNPNQSTLDMLARWAEEDAADGPIDPAEAQREWEAFRDAMNAHSNRGHPIYP